MLPYSDLSQTNACIRTLLERYQENVVCQKNVAAQIRAVEEEKQAVMQKCRKVEQKSAEKSGNIEVLQGKIKECENLLKVEREKWTQEREEVMRKCADLIAQQTYYQGEIVKREKEIGRLQDQVNFCMFTFI